MYRLFVAIDDSEHSLRAARYAPRRAKNVPCKIDLLHVEKPVMAWEVGPISSIEDVSDVRVAGSKEVLAAAASQFEQTKVERHAATGEPAVVILRRSNKARRRRDHHWLTRPWAPWCRAARFGGIRGSARS